MGKDIVELIFIRKELIKQKNNAHAMLKKLYEMKITGITEEINITEEETRVRRNLVLVNRCINLCDKLMRKPNNAKLEIELQKTYDEVTTHFD